MKIRIFGFILLILAIIVKIFSLSPIPQSQTYHDFADKRIFVGIPNFFDVFSNISFLLVGFLGIRFLYKINLNEGKTFHDSRERRAYWGLFIGVALTSLGSAYYHLSPNNQSLLWDRLPMAIAFSALISIILTEFINQKLGIFSLFPLQMLGIFSVIYWYFSELKGNGDLRLYIVFQLCSIAVIPLAFFIFPARYSRSSDFILASAMYVLAKLLEENDAEIFNLYTIVSGHTLKHVSAALGVLFIIRMLQKRALMGE